MHAMQTEENLMLKNNYLLTKLFNNSCLERGNIAGEPKKKCVIISTIYCLYYIFYQKRGVDMCMY